jgi:hypothetical protein
MSEISTTGWIVIAIISVLLFIIIMRRGIKLGFGDKTVTVGMVERRLNHIKTDEETRNTLFKFSQHVDNNLKGDLRRVVRNMDEAISSLNGTTKCEFTGSRIADIIKGEFFQRIDDNNLKERLSLTQRDGYYRDIERRIKERYQFFQAKTAATQCGDKYPDWDAIEPSMFILIQSWGDASIKVLTSRIQEKIDEYTDAKPVFISEEARKASCDDCIERNNGYLKALGVEA